MKNKVLIKLIVPGVGKNFDVFIPVNELIWKVKTLIVKVIIDMSGVSFSKIEDLVLMNKDTCKIYNNNEIIIDTDIRNGTELLLITKNDEIVEGLV